MTKRRIEDLDPETAAKVDAEYQWKAGFVIGPKGTIIKCPANIEHALSAHPDWRDVLAYDEFRACPVKLRPPPTFRTGDPAEVGDWTETDTGRVIVWLRRNFGWEMPERAIEIMLATVADRTRFHPVRTYLDLLKWDGVQRIGKLLPSYFGAADTDYSRAVGQRWMISAVARIMRPGCKADCMLVLEGKQGTFKSTALRALVGDEWFRDTHFDVGSKDAYQVLRGVWVYEFSELSAVKRGDLERVKAFLSSQEDHYRPSFGRRVASFPRQIIFAGSTNEVQYLNDPTGARRFWPVACTGRLRIDEIRRDRDQLWAEAVALYKAGEAWHLDSPELVALAEDEQADRTDSDGWGPVVQKWLRDPKYGEASEDRSFWGSLDPKEGITTFEACVGAIGFRPDGVSRWDEMRMGQVLRGLGWVRRRCRGAGGERAYRYFPVVTDSGRPLSLLDPT